MWFLMVFEKSQNVHTISFFRSVFPFSKVALKSVWFRFPYTVIWKLCCTAFPCVCFCCPCLFFPFSLTFRVDSRWLKRCSHRKDDWAHCGKLISINIYHTILCLTRPLWVSQRIALSILPGRSSYPMGTTAQMKTHRVISHFSVVFSHGRLFPSSLLLFYSVLSLVEANVKKFN